MKQTTKYEHYNRRFADLNKVLEDFLYKEETYKIIGLLFEVHKNLKTGDCFNNNHYNQCLKYLKVSKNQLALLVNFNSHSLEYNG